MGRPSDFTDALAAEICERIVLGETIAEICDLDHMPGETTVYRWLQSNEGFREQYARAREDSGNKSADVIQRIARQVEAGTMAPDAARVAIDAHKWIAGKRKPKVYGDRQILDVGDDTLRQLSDERVETRLADLLGKAGIALALGGKGKAEGGEPS